MKTVGSNPTLKDKKVSIQAKKPFLLMPKSDEFSHVLAAVKDICKLAGNCGFSNTIERIREIATTSDLGR